MKLSHREQAHRHGRYPDGDISQPGDHVLGFESTIESIVQFGEITGQVLGTDGMVGSMKRVLYATYQRVYEGELFAKCGDDSGFTGRAFWL